MVGFYPTAKVESDAIRKPGKRLTDNTQHLTDAVASTQPRMSTPAMSGVTRFLPTEDAYTLGTARTGWGKQLPDDMRFQSL